MNTNIDKQAIQLTTYTHVLEWLNTHGYIILDTSFSLSTRMASVLYEGEKSYKVLVFFIDDDGVVYRYDETGERVKYRSMDALINS